MSKTSSNSNMKYVDTLVTFEEFPDEISLCINISNCPCHCEGCHSSYLAQDIGDMLDQKSLFKLIDTNSGITCIGFMGGDANTSYINYLAKSIKEKYPEIRVGWYSGRQELSTDIDLRWFNYIKLGPFRPEFGPLTNSTTNQRMYSIIDGEMIDITERFWREQI